MSMDQPHPVTMATVARAAGVHQTTVSLALRNHRSIPAATTERIRKIANELGYRPNPMVSALIAQRRSGRSNTQGAPLAFLTNYKTRDGWRHSTNYVTLFEEMQAYAATRGYHLEDFWLAEPDMTPDRIRDILLHRGIRGIIVCPMPSAPYTLTFDFSEFAVLSLGLTLQSPVLDRVSIDYYAVMGLCVQKLLERGHRRIGFSTTLDIDNRVNHLSLGAFLAERHLRPRRFVAPFTPEKWESGALQKWIKTARPDALITSISPHFQQLKNWLQEMPVKHRPTLELACVDCSPDIRDQHGIIQDIRTEARAAVDWISSRVERAQFGVPGSPQTIMVAGSWRD